MVDEDIRWQQRFNNFNKAFKKLSDAVNYVRDVVKDESEEVKLSDLENIVDDIVKEGLIQRFEYTHELAWNVMRDYAIYQGNPDVSGSRDSTREALQLQLITNGEVWMEMIKSRKMTSHTYNEETANDIFIKIIKDYYPAFFQFQKIMEGKKIDK
jgi:nucleotidyltransferase substrate binding protein (TIGR01987 family)